MENSCELSGWLLKWTNVLKGYQKRWFILQNSLLSYYRDPETVGRRCRGTFDLSGAQLQAPKDQTSFVLVEGSGRKHHLKALTDEEKERWIRVLLTVIKNECLNTDFDSDILSEDSNLIADRRVAARPVNSNGRHRGFFRARLHDRSKLDARHSSSPNLPHDAQVAAQNDERIPPPRTDQKSVIREAPDSSKTETGSRTLLESPSQPNMGSDSCAYVNYPKLSENLRRQSASVDLYALYELNSSVEVFKRRLKEHTSAVCKQLAVLEELLAKPGIDRVLENVASLRAGPANDGKNVASEHERSEVAQNAARLRAELCEHRAQMKDFHKTCLEALQFLSTNFDRWQRRIQTEQERCIGLERTVEQLARQHRALELQLSHCYASSLEDASIDSGPRGPRTGTLRRVDTDRRPSVQGKGGFPEDDEDELFYDATEARDAVTGRIDTSPKAGKIAADVGLRASTTSLDSLKYAEESSVSDTGSEEDSSLGLRNLGLTPGSSQKAILKATDEEKDQKPATLLEKPETSLQKPVRKRRTTIPPSPKIALNLWSLLKNSIGKELSKIPLPVNFNEPLSFLQRAAEDYSYSYLIDKAAQCKDPADQMALIAAYTITCYNSTAIRTVKPFNPLLGETYELDLTEESQGWRFIAEQVIHHPPTSAIYCESLRYGWKGWIEFVITSKFRGKYMNVIPKGTAHVTLPDGSHYSWTKVITVVHNFIVGSLWIDNSGESVIRNHTNGYTCSLRFIPYSYFSRGPYRQVKGMVKDSNGVPRRSIQAIWDSFIDVQPVLPDGTPTEEPQRLWTIDPLPPEAADIYYFTRFTVMLNEPEEGVAPTDSRNRPDQRLMENGLWDQANEEKRRLEQKQRAKRYRWEEMKAAGVEPLEPLFTPLWFVNELDPITGEYSYVFGQKYWEAKEKQDWGACPDIF
ncbi:unnamed protein product [Calicophoron daubneyi]|uniref:PH domain-containing protein n=1 Tax=Calicophoron daubneyi TaxID=300641 RepID=A0AAV2T7H8_CALDB